MVVNFSFSNNENEKYFTVSGGHNEIVEDNCLDSNLQVIHDSLFMSLIQGEFQEDIDFCNIPRDIIIRCFGGITNLK